MTNNKEKRFTDNDTCPFCTKINPANATECSCGAIKGESMTLQEYGKEQSLEILKSNPMMTGGNH
jgi:hypothetical protein